MIPKQVKENVRRWASTLLEELDLIGVSLGALSNFKGIVRGTRSNAADLELLRVIDAARWDGLTLWQLNEASPASASKLWEGEAAELDQLLSRSSNALNFQAFKHLSRGCQLRKLKEDFPERISYHRKMNARLWLIRSANDAS
jgi:hypothetical protein